MNERYVVDGKTTGTTRGQMIKTSMLALIVLSIHVVAIGGFFAIQGCGTVQKEPRAVEPAPAPVMPPKAAVTQQKAPAAPRRAIRPLAPVDPAPPVMDHKLSSETYVVQKGDSISKIAQRYDVSSKEICELNNIKNPNAVRVGQKLILPAYAKKMPHGSTHVSSASSSSKKPAGKPASSAPASKPTIAGGEYVVKSGDMLSKIAVKSGTTVKALREANKLTNDKIVVGQKLIIPKSSATAASAGTTAITSGKPATETASASADLALKPGAPSATVTPVASPTAPAAAASDVKTTIIAEEVKIEAKPDAAASAAPSAAEEAFYYKVMDGDSVDKVAMTFGMTKEEIIKANNLQADAELKPGQRLLIPFVP